MNERILITYATRADSTKKIAAVIGEELSKRDFIVEIFPVKNQPSVDGYAAVLIGSAIRMGNWLPEAVEFIKKNQAQLNALPTALFTVHILNTGEDEQSKTNRQAYMNNVHLLLKPVEEVFFTGKMELKRLSFGDRLIAKAVKAVDADRRDWDKVRDWAKSVPLINEPPAEVEDPVDGV